MGCNFSNVSGESINSKWNSEVIVVKCKKCGNKSVMSEECKDKTCLYCGSADLNHINEIAGIRPEGVMAFSISKEEAINNIRKYLEKNSMFMPKSFRRKFQPENIQGFYMPFWSYDADVESTYKGKKGTVYNHRAYRTSEDTTPNREVKWSTMRGNLSFNLRDKLIADSEKFSKEADALLPYDTSKIVRYEHRYIASCRIEKYHDGPESCYLKFKDKMDKVLKDSVEKKLLTFYDKVRINEINNTYSNEKYRQLLLPVWSMEYTYSGEKYVMLVNGQSGKVYSDYPISNKKIFMIIAFVALLGFLIWRIII